MEVQHAAASGILPFHNRALKEWAVACEAMKRGIQSILIRKGGIREEDGIFLVTDTEFFLLPTYEHQDPSLLRKEFEPLTEMTLLHGHDPRSINIDSFAVVDSVLEVIDEDRLYGIREHHIWNEEYVKQRLDFNPYDPLYVILLRIYRLPESVTLPLRPEYEGCKSWVTLERPLSTAGSTPVLADSDFKDIREATLSALT